MLKAQLLNHLGNLGNGADKPLGATLMTLIEMTVFIRHVGIMILQGRESCSTHLLMTEVLSILATVNPHCIVKEQVAIVAGGVTVEHLEGAALTTCRQTHFHRDIFGVVAGDDVAAGHHKIDVSRNVLATAGLTFGNGATEVVTNRSSVGTKVEHRSVFLVYILQGQRLMAVADVPVGGLDRLDTTCPDRLTLLMLCLHLALDLLHDSQHRRGRISSGDEHAVALNVFHVPSIGDQFHPVASDGTVSESVAKSESST